MDKLQIGERFRTLLAQKGIELKQVSLETNIPYSTLYAWTENRQPQSLIKLKRLADYFDITLDELLFQERTKKEPLISGRYEVFIKKIDEND